MGGVNLGQTSNNKKSKSKKHPTKIEITALVVIPIVAILAPMFFTWLTSAPDFNVSIEPMTGIASPGSSIQNAITLDNIHGYTHEVVLSVIVPNSGLAVSLQSNEGLVPPYKTTVTTDVSPTIPFGTYEVTITATGGDGKEHTCKYFLTIQTPNSTVTPSPSANNNSLASPSVSANPSVSTSPSSTLPSSSPIPTQNTVQMAQIGKLNDTKYVNQVAYSPDGKLLAIASQDIFIYDAKTLSPIYNFPMDFDSLSMTAQGLTFSADSKMLAVCAGDGFFIFKTDGWALVFHKTNIGIQWDAQCISFSPDGRLFAITTDSAVQLWNVGSWTVNNTLPAGSPTVVAFSPDGKTLAASGDTAGIDIKLWDYYGNSIKTLTGHTNWINTIAFSADGKILASGSVDKKIWLWDMVNGNQLRVMLGNNAEVNAVAFSPDGKLLASCSTDLIVKVWDVTTGQLLASQTGHTSTINSVAFSADGQTLASGGNDGVLLWSISH